MAWTHVPLWRRHPLWYQSLRQQALVVEDMHFQMDAVDDGDGMHARKDSLSSFSDCGRTLLLTPMT